MYATGEVPAHGASSLELIGSGHVVARANAPRARLSVLIVAVRRKGPLTTTRSRARPAKAITHIEIDYASDGRHFHPVLLCVTGTSVTPPSATVRATPRARIVIDDGFTSVQATSSLATAKRRKGHPNGNHP
jgi:hypothetical protein